MITSFNISPKKNFLHSNYVVRSDKQVSAQGTVYYVKGTEPDDPNEYVLKIVSHKRSLIYSTNSIQRQTRSHTTLNRK